MSKKRRLEEPIIINNFDKLGRYVPIDISGLPFELQEAFKVIAHWNSKEEFINHEVTRIMQERVRNVIKIYGKAETVNLLIDRYYEAFTDKDFWFNTKWRLDKFIKHKNAISAFEDDGKTWLDYCKFKKLKEDLEYKKDFVKWW